MVDPGQMTIQGLQTGFNLWTEIEISNPRIVGFDDMTIHEFEVHLFIDGYALG